MNKVAARIYQSRPVRFLDSFRIKKSLVEKYSYALDYDDARKIRMLGAAGLMSLFTLIIGIYYFVTQSVLLAMVFAPFFVIVVLYNVIAFVLMSQFPSFSIAKHKDRVAYFTRFGKHPKVAILIPAAGEDLRIVTATMKAALKIDYPDFKVFVLDDSAKAIYKQSVQGSGAVYFRRSETGYHKKAGNLNALLPHLKDFEYALVLDADFVPSPEMLREMIPYTAENVSIVQTPQHFDVTKQVYKRSRIEYGAALIQQDFYRITQTARGRVGGAICVGTNALYRLEAINLVGGYEGVGSKKTGGHSEDVFTGLKTLNTLSPKGESYSIRYVPVALAKGICPSDHLSFYKQQHRWATGSMQLITSPKTLFSRRLTLSQKMCYFSNSLYYFYTIAVLLSPLQLLVLGLMDVTYSWEALLLFAPSLAINFILLPFVLRKPVNPFAATLVVISNAYTFLQALYLLFIKKPLGWEATGASHVVKKHTRYAQFKVISALIFIIVYLMTLSVLIVHSKIGLNASIVMVGLFIVGIVAHAHYLYHTLLISVIKKTKRTIRALYTVKEIKPAVITND